jgi:hypothetical protein
MAVDRTRLALALVGSPTLAVEAVERWREEPGQVVAECAVGLALAAQVVVLMWVGHGLGL